MPHVDHIVNGVAWPSVTEILAYPPKPWLEKWRDKWGVLAERKTDEATKVGTAFHAAAEALVLGRDVVLPANRRLANMLEQFDSWVVKWRFVPKETELHVVSTLYEYAGTFDATGYMVDKPR